ncbi:MAG TPA: hypothetical protein VJ208_02325 [Candidatus Nanoarchaeia archaeon]|nr:hypothetical protein [Candidatus Nanoarchaeia archaeon]
MIPIIKEAVLIKPNSINPTSKNLEVVGTFNPGAERLDNGDIVLYVRVAEGLIKKEDKNFCYSPRCEGGKTCRIVVDRIPKDELESSSYFDCVLKDGTKRLTFVSHLRRVILDTSGFKVKSIDSKPSFGGNSEEGELGIEDPRITKIGKEYYMTYVALSIQGNISTHLAKSRDCLNWKRLGTIFSEQNKDVALFPEKINGKYYAFNRPESNFQFSLPHIWISHSKDLLHWGHHKPVKISKKGAWDYSRIGAGSPPIKTDKGWLLLYHGVKEKMTNDNFFGKLFGFRKELNIYQVGVALFDLKKPWKLIAKSKNPIITPKKEYEKNGFVKNVVFSTDAVLDKDKKHLLIFSGGGDSVVSVKKVLLKDVLDSLERV